jgi:phage shock protein A
MFEDLRDAFREAVDNFNKELHRDQVPRTVDELLAGMTNELAEESAQATKLEAELERTTATSQRERDAAATCRRREQMARGIGDEETATLAAQHAAKHEGHHLVLEKKADALRDELAFRRKSIEEMTAQLAEARQKRGSLGASAGRTGARRALSDADDLFSELDRMAEKMEGGKTRADAVEALDDLDLGDAERAYNAALAEEPAAPPPREELDVDAALAELKRRMGKS